MSQRHTMLKTLTQLICPSMMADRYCEEIPAEENEISNDNSSKSSGEAKAEGSPLPTHKKSLSNSALHATNTSSIEAPLSVSPFFSPITSQE